MVENKKTPEQSSRAAWIAIVAFGVLVLYLAGLLSSHLRNGAAVFDSESTSFMHSVVAFPVKSLGVWSTYLLVLALASQTLCLWLNIRRGHVARRTIGLILLILGFSCFLGVSAELSGGESHAAWGGGYGIRLAAFFLILGGPLGFVLSMALFGFGVFLGRDWFEFDRIRSLLGKAPEEAFGLGMPAEGEDNLAIEDSKGAGAESIASIDSVELDAGDAAIPLILDAPAPVEADPLHVDESSWSEMGSVPDLSHTEVSDPLDDPLANPWAEIPAVSNDDPMPEPSAEKPIEIEFSEADPHETQEIEPVELQSLDTDRHADEMMFDSDEASEAAKGSVTLASARHEINSETDVIVMDDAFQSELPFDVEPPILYKSERAESAAPDEETEIEETMDESEQSPEVSEEEPATVPETEVTSDNSESEVVLNAVAEGEATEDAPALGKPMATETKTRSDDWAAWMTDDASTEPRTGIAKPTYPSAAASTGAPLSAVEPEGLEGYHGAVAVVLERDQCSVSLLQRELGISFGAAAAAVEQMEKDRIVGPYQGSGHREVLMTTDTWRARLR